MKDSLYHCNNISHLHQVFSDPYKFDPERFLDNTGQLVAADHPHRVHLMPFGAGARVCVGEVLASTRMFLILASIMQRFTLLPETVLSEQPSCDARDYELAITMVPPDFKVRLMLRE